MDINTRESILLIPTNYGKRRKQLREIGQFYGPRLRVYHKLEEAAQRAWRQSDPLLDDILRFARQIEKFGGKGLD